MEQLFAAFTNAEQHQYPLLLGLLSLAFMMTAAQRRQPLSNAVVGARGTRLGLGLVTLALVLGLSLGGPIARVAVAQSTPTTQSTPATMDPISVFTKVGPAVVTILNEQKKHHFLQPSTEEVAAAGSGFFIDQQGHIVTNNHVVEGGNQFEVIFADGTAQPAKLVGTDPISDLAVLQVTGPPPAVAALGDSTGLQPGQSVLAIGSPLGTFTNTVTEGIVGAIGRSLSENPKNPGLPLTNLIQHDAPINPGNSGGPLVDLTGQVIGVNTLAVTEAEPNVSAQGLFFAIPANTVKLITTQLIATGQVVYPDLGVSEAVVLTPTLAQLSDLPVNYGVYVSKVDSGGPADKAGIKADDIIVAVNGKQIGPETSIIDALFAYKPGDTVQVTVQRGNGQQTFAVTLGSRPSS